jgi:peptidoglycan-associated lipoprotein
MSGKATWPPVTAEPSAPPAQAIMNPTAVADGCHRSKSKLYPQQRSAIMPRPASTLALATSIGLLVSACGGQKPLAVAAPPASARPLITALEAAQPEVSTSPAPGSQADLLAQAGTDTVLFPLDSHDLDPQAQSILLRHAAWLQRNPAARIALEGHCDERGTREHNLALGERRANAAKNFLANQGIAVDRMSTISYGKERPAVDGSDEAAWTRNRRAVTVIIGG